MARAMEIAADEREYLSAIRLVGGIVHFYELRLRKNNLNISDDTVMQSSKETKLT